MIGERLLKDS